jgi:hypothetical protein
MRTLLIIYPATIPVPVPAADITATAAYAYNWPTVLEDLQK